jgi:hypothetical protein
VGIQARRSRIKASDGDNVAFTLLRRPTIGDVLNSPPLSIEEHSKAKVILVQGFFNERTEQLIECRVIEANEMDAEMAEAHNENQILVYE